MRKWSFFTAKEIEPQGWLRDQLIIQSKGLAGNLDSVWRDVRESTWIGGSVASWERVPYWLDGFITLAALLRDESMLSRAKKYVDGILAIQCDDGWLCPCTLEERSTYDTWAIILISKVLTVYHECTGDERIPKAVYRALKSYYEHLASGKLTLFRWNHARWFETFIALAFVKEHFDEPWIKEFAHYLRDNGMDWFSLKDRWEIPQNVWTLETHIVNIAMMLKLEAITCDLLDEEYTNKAEDMYQHLYKYNGTVYGGFTGDECLSGLSPIQGTELCAIVEQMYSYEHLFAYTGDTLWADRLELMAYNALPATISDDMWTHQYDQLVNQVACIRFPDVFSLGKAIFRTNVADAMVFGLEPQFGCCTANHGQGWPKLAVSTFMFNSDSVISLLPAPATLDCAKCRATVDTLYPFGDGATYTVSAREDMNFVIRIPSFVESPTLTDGDVNIPINASLAEVHVKKGETRTFKLSFTRSPKLVPRPNGLNAVICGPLIYVAPIPHKEVMYEYTKDEVERKFPYCDYELLPTTSWGLAFAGDTFTYTQGTLTSTPFSSKEPPSTVTASMVPIPWGAEDGFDLVCAKIPQSLTPLGASKPVTLVPYGASRLRLTEMPKLK